MIENIKLTTEYYVFDFAKNKYILKGTEVSFINEIFYNNATCKETVKLIKRLSSNAYNKKANTKFGRKVVKNINTSPSGKLKIIRYFDFSIATEV